MTITEFGLWLSHTLSATVTTKSLVWDATAGVSMPITELGLWVTSHTGCHGYDKEFGLRCHSWGFHDCYRAWFVSDVTLWFKWLRCSRLKGGVALSVGTMFRCSARQTAEPLLIVRICKAQHIHQNLTVPQLVKISSAFYGPLRFPLLYTLTHILNQMYILRATSHLISGRHF